MSSFSNNTVKKSSNLVAWIAPIGCIIMGVLIYVFVLGAQSNFLKPNHQGPYNWMGRMYEGGYIIPILIGFLLMVLVFSIERLITFMSARGKNDPADFINIIREYLDKKDVESALLACDYQKGVLGNVMRSGLQSYKRMEGTSNLTTEQKIQIIQKDIEEASTLEIPVLDRNMIFLSTLTSLSVLVALLGTVLGMIRSFANLGDAAGASELARGISEALYNTALGIATGAFAMVAYSFFVSKTESLNNEFEESGMILTQSYIRNHQI